MVTSRAHHTEPQIQVSGFLPEEVNQAEIYVNSINALNESPDIMEPGQLNGLSKLLKNAERTLATSRTALIEHLVRQHRMKMSE